MVAEKNRFWRLAGSMPMSLRMAWMKPRSSIWSTSSRTKISTLARLTARRSIRSTSRPGVATRMSTPLLQSADLVVDRDAAEDDRMRKAQKAAIGAERSRRSGRRVRGSARGSARGSCAARAALALGGEILQDGQREGRRLAGAGLGDAQQIAALQQMRDRLRLDRGGGLIAFGGQCLEQAGPRVRGR